MTTITELDKQIDQTRENANAIRSTNPTRAVYQDGFADGLARGYTTIAAQAAQIERMRKNIEDYKKVTSVLGAGIGEISVPYNFLGLWNETEI